MATIGAFLLMAALSSVSASAEEPAATVSTPPAEPQYGAYRSYRLTVEANWDGKGYRVLDSLGRTLPAAAFAERIGDRERYARARSRGKVQTVIGVSVLGVGGAGMYTAFLLAVTGAAAGDDGLRLLGAGVALAGAGGIGTGIYLLADRTPRRPPAYWTVDEASRAADEYNANLRTRYGVPADWLGAVRSPVEVRVSVGPGSAGLEVRF